ncbi:unnamed protein product [Rangifer tarandus platyrhynchus]|uniref:Uncharacterized protein n=2 Tax=Rangifer tarandus platyrhynchus TaxID=3082113 RepID=A0ACB0E7E5_RANTA|nr:unnamed protein product [Rangifer tarandus platyrhynchus]
MGYFLRTLQLLSTCVAISLVGSLDSWTVPTSNWSFVILCFCFVVTFIILIIESLALHYCFSFSWGDFLLCHACYLALFCLLVSIIYPATYVQFLFYTPSWDHAIAATAFCFISTVAYATEAIWILGWPQTGDFTGYIGSLPFLLKMLETLVACVILPFISNPSLYMDHPLLVSALVLWLLYQFYEEFGGQPQRSSDGDCRDELTYDMCTWDQRLAVAVLTAINLLIYMADLGYWARQLSVGTEDQPRDS